MSDYDLVVKGGTVVIPYVGARKSDIGVRAGKIATIAEDIPREKAEKVVNAAGKHVFPGAVDSHFHVGIYRPFKEDATSESTSAASGGVTSILTYFRPGKNYLNKTGPYKELFPELLDLSRGSYLTDYGYHLTMNTEAQIREMEWLVREKGCSTFKYYMFYKLLNLAGSSADGTNYLMTDTPVDFGFLYKYMKEVSRLSEMFRDYGRIALSIHCENPEVIRATNAEVIERPSGNPLKDYSDARPPWQEELAIHEVAIMANHTNCPVNLLHLSSRKAVEAGMEVSTRYPHLSFLLEGTLHHLGLSNDMNLGRLAKVNPPIRSRDDVNCLWKSVLDDTIKTVVSDHACVTKEIKKGDLWTSLPGFGGTSLMFPILVTEGYHRRGLPLHRIAELSSSNPAKIHNLYPKKGALMVGSDADLAIVDIEEEKEVTLDRLFTAQDFSPEQGMKLKGWADCTILRGRVIFEKGKVVGEPGYGEFIKRPVRLHYKG
ncbi:MAG: dihydroorotase family protein [Deltaproteobacteria bacterium]|nr:dihydroorotase family protein [Deltaproteobacteria bacterium]MBW1956512.1 dihydroorotase family protein [Deltaproteobacteria bacterium]MBW2041854.1 dihydroorotase family protein [Deltaproteobacteria bacterium]